MNERTWVLDLGCGAMRTPRTVDRLVCGLDVNFESLREAMKRDTHLLVCGRGEQLPFRDRCFSSVVSNVAVPYMDIPTALGEIERVLRPGGSVWLSLHPLGMTVRELFHAIRVGNVRNTFYRLYILANGVYFLLVGKLFRFPLQRGRCESFQTETAMRRAMLAHEFSDIRWERESGQMVVTAEKRG